MNLNQNILITGGTGSFGKKFLKMTLARYNPKKIVIFSRDEMKQWELSKEYRNEKKIRFFIGDVRDKERLNRALDGIDIVIHAAALKIVPISEYDPFETVKTNILGAMNIIDTCINRGVKKVVALSTDKAVNPVNLYGSTKLAADKLFIAGNEYSAFNKTKFSIVRYGNVMGSRGSIIPHLFSQKKEKKPFTITDVNMTRFMTNLDSAVRLVWKVFDDMKGGEIYVQKNPSVKIIDIAKAIDEKKKIEIIGIRPGEKINETMISQDDSRYTYSYKNYYKILPSINNWNEDKVRIKNGKKVELGFQYVSDINSDWMTTSEIKKWILKNFENDNLIF
jgi:UDP-N-acetylglucosamine 4,6-dehydratase (inverting)